MNPVLVAPSLLSADFARLAEEIGDAERSGADLLHLDVMDGHFVDNITFGPPLVKTIRKHSSVPLDAHLMITDPDRYAPAFIEAGADIVSFHIEARPDPAATIELIRSRGAKPSIAINPSTPIDGVVPYLKDLEMVLVMSVHPGFGGQAFRPDVLEKIVRLRKVHGYTGRIEIDGGIAPDTAAAARAAGADVLVAGTAVFRERDRARAIRALRE